MTALKKWAGRRSVQRLFWVVLLGFIWQVAVSSGRVSPLLLPAPRDVAATLAHGILQGDLVAQVAFSLAVILLGMAIALLVSIAMAAISLHSRVAASLTDALCALAHPLPAIALLPLIIVWFGIGFWAVAAIIVHAVLWPILLNLTAGFRATPRVYLESGRNLSSSALWLLFQVYLPASSSHLIAGIKIGWARAWRALISAEMIFGAVGRSGGVGWYLFQSRVMMDTAGLFAGIVLVVCIGILVEELLAWVERRTVIRWGMSTQ